MICRVLGWLIAELLPVQAVRVAQNRDYGAEQLSAREAEEEVAEPQCGVDHWHFGPFHCAKSPGHDGEHGCMICFWPNESPRSPVVPRRMAGQPSPNPLGDGEGGGADSGILPPPAPPSLE